MCEQHADHGLGSTRDFASLTVQEKQIAQAFVALANGLHEILPCHRACFAHLPGQQCGQDKVMQDVVAEIGQPRRLPVGDADQCPVARDMAELFGTGDDLRCGQRADDFRGDMGKRTGQRLA